MEKRHITDWPGMGKDSGRRRKWHEQMHRGSEARGMQDNDHTIGVESCGMVRMQKVEGKLGQMVECLEFKLS